MTNEFRADGEAFAPPEFDPTEPHVSERFEPDRVIRKRLHEECVRAIGYAAADIRWSEQRGCLCVFEKDRRGFVCLRREIRDDRGYPRQADERDIREFVDNIYGRSEVVDNFVKKFLAKKADAKEKSKQERREMIHETAEELVRVAKFGTRTYVEMSAPETDGGEQTSFEVIDRRRAY
jgi:hypothetical protein